MALNKGFNLLIVVAVIAAAICIYLVIKVVDSANQQTQKALAQARNNQAVETETILVAKQDISIGQTFKKEDVDTKDFPKTLVPATALHKFEDLNGKVSQTFIPQGDLLLSVKVGTIEQLPRPSLQVTVGSRLVTIRVDDTKGNAYLVRNGDYVDLLLTVDVPKYTKDADGQWLNVSATKTLLQNVKVFDVDHGTVVVSDPNGGKGQAPEGQRLGMGSTATFEVSPEDAEIIINAENKGKISLMLRRYDDRSVADTKGYVETQLTEDIKPYTQVPVEQKPAAPEPPKKKAFY
ncbi:MAG: Flp pilus assembly protein CpaB [Verrucomicrobiales bacterium]|jgi:pilus assembly protein CpaB|nr:Flp pilus assembly protein CpaB [Verrucomicrobiales bacterium]